MKWSWYSCRFISVTTSANRSSLCSFSEHSQAGKSSGHEGIAQRNPYHSGFATSRAGLIISLRNGDARALVEGIGYAGQRNLPTPTTAPADSARNLVCGTVDQDGLVYLDDHFVALRSLGNLQRDILPCAMGSPIISVHGRQKTSVFSVGSALATDMSFPCFGAGKFRRLARKGSGNFTSARLPNLFHLLSR
jgi:hypothetical protein